MNTATLTQISNPSGEAFARWIPAPQGSAICPYTGMKHGTFYRNYHGNRNVKQVSLAKGRKRGKRLFWLPDLLAELDRLAAEQSQTA